MVGISDNRIRARSGGVLSVPSRTDKPVEGDERQKLMPPKARGFASIPTPEVLDRLIAQAVSALRHGIFWDRGSILNLVV